jgi:hypothetical protein
LVFTLSDYYIYCSNLCNLKDIDGSLILTVDERDAALSLTSSSDGLLLYRASNNAFSSSIYYSKLSGKANVITIFRSKNNVFGAYMKTANAYSSGGWVTDSSAFLFSLRRNGTSNTVKLPVIESQYALYSSSSYFGYYGRGLDLYVNNQPFANTGSYAQLGLSYRAPSGCSYNTPCAYNFFAGSYNGWYVDEIEAYQFS